MLLKVEYAEVKMSSREVGVQTERLGKRGGGFRVAILLGKSGTKVVVDVRAFRGKLHSAAQLGRGFFQVLVAECPP